MPRLSPRNYGQNGRDIFGGTGSSDPPKYIESHYYRFGEVSFEDWLSNFEKTHPGYQYHSSNFTPSAKSRLAMFVYTG